VLYTVRHVTRFTYEAPISESVMEARMQPRSDAPQRCLRFGLSTAPAARVKMYADHDGNIVHHFNIPGRHSRLTLTAEALVECAHGSDPPEALDAGAWDRLDELTGSGEFWELLNPSPFAQPTALLDGLQKEIGVARGDDPLAVLRRLMSELYERIEYCPQATRVDSPIDDALRARSGVCQDFSHIFIAMVRPLGIPCRYVSGYLFQEKDSHVRSTAGATHAWAEALLPDIGWIGFDATNNLIAGSRHIRVAIGRDYTDVPPTRGVFKGVSAVRSDLAVGVTVGSAQPIANGEVAGYLPWVSREAIAAHTAVSDRQQQQQQQ
jgi:transglutaminase-like putative cysteine protease